MEEHTFKYTKYVTAQLTFTKWTHEWKNVEWKASHTQKMHNWTMVLFD